LYCPLAVVVVGVVAAVVVVARFNRHGVQRRRIIRRRFRRLYLPRPANKPKIFAVARPSCIGRNSRRQHTDRK
jgi:hypothetical protein